MSCRSWCATSPASSPLVSSRMRARTPLPSSYPRAARESGAEHTQPFPRTSYAYSARARNPARRRRKRSTKEACRGSRRRFLLRASAGVGPRGGGDADSQLCASRAQPNGQVLHVLRAAAPSSHSPGERAHDARRPAGGSLKSHPVVGGIPLTPRYSPRPRLDNVRPAAAPPEEPPDNSVADSSDPTVGTDDHVDASDITRDVHAALRPPVSEAPVGPT